MMRLIFVEGSQKGQRYPVDGDGGTLGRERKNDIPVDDLGASRLHATLYFKDGILHVRDEKSTNGTFVNSKKISDSPLQDGDRIGIGDTVILIEGEVSGALPQVMVSEAEHDASRDISVKVDSTVLMNSGALERKGIAAHDLLRSLFDFTNTINGEISLENLLSTALDEICKTLKADSGVILFLDKTDDLRPRAAWPKGSGNLTVSQTITESVLASGQGVLSNLAGGGAGMGDSLIQRDVGSVLCAPLMAEDRTLGVVYLETRRASLPFAESCLYLLSCFSIPLAIAIQNANLYRSMRNSEEFASCVLKSMSSGILVIDERGCIVRVNDMACEILGLQQKDVVGVSISSMSELREMYPVVAKTRSTGIPHDQEEMRIFAQDREIPAGVSTSLLEDYAGHTSGVICTFRDLTRIKKLDNELKRSRDLAALGEMAAGIAHEVRNPLNSVQGFAQLLEEDSRKRSDASGIEYAGIIIEEVARINNIVQDMLDFTRQSEISMHKVNMAELLDVLVIQMRQEAMKRGVDMKYEKLFEKEPVVMGSFDKLKQVFMNIIRNAYEACSQGGNVKVVLSTAKSPNGIYPEAVVKINDDGCGIEEEKLAAIFNPFFTTKDVGTGLGLSICQNIIHQHSGRINVSSQPGLGTVFTISIPMTE